jgi:hypothetical protein
VQDIPSGCDNKEDEQEEKNNSREEEYVILLESNLAGNKPEQ